MILAWIGSIGFVFYPFLPLSMEALARCLKPRTIEALSFAYFRGGSKWVTLRVQFENEMYSIKCSVPCRLFRHRRTSLPWHPLWKDIANCTISSLLSWLGGSGKNLTFTWAWCVPCLALSSLPLRKTVVRTDYKREVRLSFRSFL